MRIDHVLRSFGGGFLADDNTRSIITDPKSIAALQFIADLMIKDRTHPFPRRWAGEMVFPKAR